MNPEQKRDMEREAILSEFNSLLEASLAEHKRQLNEADELFELEHKKAFDEIENPKGTTVYSGEELAQLYIEKLNEATERSKRTVRKILQDTKEKLESIHSEYRVEQIMNEVNAAEWKKYFGDL